ncbi:MAG: hypothetical protein ACKVQT_13885 [Burkholderiales bacterium]
MVALGAFSRRAASRRHPRTLPGNARAIDEAVAHCRRLVTRRSLMSAGVVLVPIPGIDIAADIALLARLVEEINQAFGLSHESIEALAPRRRILVYRAIVVIGGAMVGRLVTQNMLMKALMTVGVRLTAVQATRYVPVAGQALAAGLSFTAMRYVGLNHLRDCEEVARRVLAVD